MFSQLERMIAFRYLRSRRSEGFISVIAGFSFVGIALGVATLIVVMAVMNGFRTEIAKKILGLNGHINVVSYNRSIENFDEITKVLREFEDVVSASAIINGQVMATTKVNTTGALIKSLRNEDILQRPLIAENIVQGSIEELDGKNNVMLGNQLSFNLGVNVGDKVTLISPQGQSTALGTLPRLKTYNVVAIFESGMYEFDNNVIFMPLEAAQIFFKYKDSVSSIEIFAKDPHNIDDLVSKIHQELGPLFRVQDWQNMNASLFNALKIERTVMFLILTLIVFIAAFNIISSLIMLVNDKSNDIAILRTMGATRPMIMRVFFLCGASIGIVGTMLGFVLGISFALNIESIRAWLESLIGNKLFDPVIYFLSELPAEVKTDDVILSVGMGIFFSFLATIYPAYKAAKQNPAEALRYE